MVNIQPSEFITADFLKFDKIDGQYYVKTTVKDPVNVVTGSGTFTDYKTNDLDTEGDTQYIGQAIPGSDIWMVIRVVTTGSDLTVTYANVSNNASYTMYATAWAARASLSYGIIDDLTFTGQPGSIPTPANPMPVIIYDAAGCSPVVDPEYCALVVMDEQHHLTHLGKTFLSGYGWQSVGTGVSKYYLFETNSDKTAHLTFKVDVTGDCTFQFFEDPTWSGAIGGVSVPPTNRNRVAPLTTDVIVKFDPNAPTTTGTLLVGARIGEGKAVSAETGSRQEFILKPNSKYLFKFTSNANSINIILYLDWYEE